VANNSPSAAYKETTIKTASQGQLIVMLYDGAVKQLDKGLELIKLNSNGKKNPARIEQISKAVLKTQEIVTELMASLDFDKGGEIAKNLFSLYTWFNYELLEGNISQDYARLLVVRNMLDTLRSAWAEISQTSSADTRPKAGINIAG
jgi:flagellar protein FliS